MYQNCARRRAYIEAVKWRVAIEAAEKLPDDWLLEFEDGCPHLVLLQGPDRRGFARLFWVHPCLEWGVEPCEVSPDAAAELAAAGVWDGRLIPTFPQPLFGEAVVREDEKALAEHIARVRDTALSAEALLLSGDYEGAVAELRPIGLLPRSEGVRK